MNTAAATFVQTANDDLFRSIMAATLVPVVRDNDVNLRGLTDNERDVIALVNAERRRRGI